MTVVTVAHYRLPDEPERSEVVTDLLPLAAATASEEDCLGIEVLRDAEDPGHLILIERWGSEAALERHRSEPHFISGILGRIAPRLVTREVFVAAPF